MKQIQITTEKEYESYKHIRNNIEKISDCNSLIKELNNFKNINSDTDKLILFIENQINKKYGAQRNNHHLMQAILKEKKESYVRISYPFLRNKISKGNKIYDTDISVKSIMSNSFLSNETESCLNVTKLEKEFINFSRSDLDYMSFENKNIVFLKKYFALQLSRRENFLYNLLNNHLFKNSKCDSLEEEIDLFDYFFLKYLYHVTIRKNYTNWLLFIDSNCQKISIQQIIYKKCIVKDVNYNNFRTYRLEPSSFIEQNLAITETHTLLAIDLFDFFENEYLDLFLTKNGFEKISIEDKENIKDIIVTIGANNKLCYLIKNDVKQLLFDKINFIIHHHWDQLMIQNTFINILIDKNFALNNSSYFSTLSDDKIERAKKMYHFFNFSKKMEKIILNHKPIP